MLFKETAHYPTRSHFLIKLCHQCEYEVSKRLNMSALPETVGVFVVVEE